MVSLGSVSCCPGLKAFFQATWDEVLTQQVSVEDFEHRFELCKHFQRGRVAKAGAHGLKLEHDAIRLIFHQQP